VPYKTSNANVSRNLNVREVVQRHSTALLAAFFSCLLLAACSGAGSGLDRTAALQTIGQLSDENVAPALDLIQTALDLAAPAVYATSEEELAAIAEATGCQLSGPFEGTYDLLCGPREMRGETTTLLIHVTFLMDGFPVADPALADALLLRIEGESGRILTEGQLHLVPDPDKGLVIDGDLSASAFDGVGLLASFNDVTARTVADLPGLATAVLFTSGSIDLDLTTPAGQPARGTAGLVGRNAVVALDLAGFSARRDLELAPRP